MLDKLKAVDKIINDNNLFIWIFGHGEPSHCFPEASRV